LLALLELFFHGSIIFVHFMHALIERLLEQYPLRSFKLMKVVAQLIEIGALFCSAVFGVFLRLFYCVSDCKMVVIFRT